MTCSVFIAQRAINFQPHSDFVGRDLPLISEHTYQLALVISVKPSSTHRNNAFLRFLLMRELTNLRRDFGLSKRVLFQRAMFISS